MNNSASEENQNVTPTGEEKCRGEKNNEKPWSKKNTTIGSDSRPKIKQSTHDLSIEKRSTGKSCLELRALHNTLHNHTPKTA